MEDTPVAKRARLEIVWPEGPLLALWADGLADVLGHEIVAALSDHVDVYCLARTCTRLWHALWPMVRGATASTNLVVLVLIFFATQGLRTQHVPAGAHLGTPQRRGFEQLLPQCRGVTTLSGNLFYQLAGPTLWSMTQLTRLTLCSPYVMVTDEDLQHLPLVTALNLAYNIRITDVGLRALPRLTSLTLCGNGSRITGAALPETLTRLVMLSDFVVYTWDHPGCNVIVEDATLQRLTRLAILGVGYDTLGIMNWLALTQLRCLSLRDMWDTCPKLNVLAQMTWLTHLDLGQTPHCEGALAKKAVRKALPWLQCLITASNATPLLAIKPWTPSVLSDHAA